MDKVFIYVLFTLFNTSCYAFTLNATVSGNNVTFSNAIQQDTNKYTLSDWEPQSNLMPTLEWAPGFTYTGADLVLSGPGGSVNVDVDVIGIEYNTGSASPTSSSPSLGASPTCDTDDFNGNVIHLENSSGECTTSYHLENKTSVMPFYFLRPIIQLDKQSIADSFQSLDNKEEGYYFGTISLPLRYWYRSIGGVVTYRNINHTFSMNVYYKPSELTEIKIVKPLGGGTAILKPKLDPGGQSISSSVTFQLVAKGLFVEGLVVELPDINEYKLTTEAGGYTIPFSITCSACDDPLLVVRGETKVDNTFISEPNSTQIVFGLNVHYDGVEIDTIRIGEYKGNFTMMFGADI